jgi:hypothetical protein
VNSIVYSCRHCETSYTSYVGNLRKIQTHTRKFAFLVVDIESPFEKNANVCQEYIKL